MVRLFQSSGRGQQSTAATVRQSATTAISSVVREMVKDIVKEAVEEMEAEAESDKPSTRRAPLWLFLVGIGVAILRALSEADEGREGRTVPIMEPEEGSEGDESSGSRMGRGMRMLVVLLGIGVAGYLIQRRRSREDWGPTEAPEREPADRPMGEAATTIGGEAEGDAMPGMHGEETIPGPEPGVEPESESEPETDEGASTGAEDETDEE